MKLKLCACLVVVAVLSVAQALAGPILHSYFGRRCHLQRGPAGVPGATVGRFPVREDRRGC